jgi:hypothetical protein
MRTLARVGATTAGLMAALLVWASPSAQAADPPDSWTNLRVLECDGARVGAYLTPAGFGSSFHLVGSTDIIKPKHVEVVFPGTTQTVTTLDVPGFDPQQHATVDCRYEDPAGLNVHFIGIRTQGER